MKQILSLLLLLTLLTSVEAQLPGDKTLDVNYTATKKSFTLRVSGRLRESDDWTVRGFRSGFSYSTPAGASRFSIGYDLWRGDLPNSPIGSSLVMGYSLNTNLTSFNLSLMRFHDGFRPESWTGRLDIVSKW